MPWLRIEDNFAEHPKVIDLSDAAFRLHVTALCHCARNLTDGFMSDKAIRHAAAKTATPMVRELVGAKLWIRTAGGYVVHDYLKYNPSRDKVLADRDAAKERRSQERNANVDDTSDERKSPRTPSPSPYPESTFSQSEKRGRVAGFSPLGVVAARVAAELERR